MAVEVKVPVLPESVSDATLSKWYRKVGDFVKQGESLVDLETDKVMIEVPAPEDGLVEKIVQTEGAVVSEGTVLAVLRKGADVDPSPISGDDAVTVSKSEVTLSPQSVEGGVLVSEDDLSPAVRRLITEHAIDPKQIKGSGKQGRIVKEDVVRFLEKKQSQSVTSVSPASTPLPMNTSLNFLQGEVPLRSVGIESHSSSPSRRVPMSRLRARIAERLLAAQHNAAMLTTFNEVNMQSIIDLRHRHREAFEKSHGTRLGFMSFFVKASVAALKRFPDVNAFIEGNDIVYHDFYDIGLAVSSPRGLVVPILRAADALSMADIERGISEFGVKAKEGKLSLEEMTGGTFTITNGGVFGSMLSTPIINPPQSAILGMHNIVKRPVVEGDDMVIRPVMYLALSYDHRIIDGSQAVRFLVTIKELLEEPARLLLDI